jgi:hypothetical protein
MCREQSRGGACKKRKHTFCAAKGTLGPKRKPGCSLILRDQKRLFDLCATQNQARSPRLFDFYKEKPNFGYKK